MAKRASGGACGVLIRGSDADRDGRAGIAAEAKKAGLAVAELGEGCFASLAMTGPAGRTTTWARALVVAAGTVVPWELAGAGLGFVERWDAAVPLWRYGVLAQDLGTAEERKATAALTLDLRIPVYACELLFVQLDGAGMELLTAWETEIAATLRSREPLTMGTSPRNDSVDERLAFLRAVARVKPRLCVLPTSWWKGQEARARKDERARRAMAMGRRQLVRVEVAPGRFVQCRAGDEERVLAQFRRRLERSGGR